MGVFGAIKREFDYVSGMLRVLREIRKVGSGSCVRVPDKIEATVDRYPDRPMALLDDGAISYRQFDAYANRVAHWALDRGLKPGDTVVSFRGSARSILTAERTMLNFMGRLSGIATHTSKFVERVADTQTKIVCTRKTTPGHRALEKRAVRCGGGTSHRYGLDDAVLIKDNHLVIIFN